MLGVGLLLTASMACSISQNQPTAVNSKAPAHGSLWHYVDLPGQYGGMRSALYDRSRDTIWILSRQRGAYADDPMFATLTGINAIDRSVVATQVRLPADGYDIGSIALDARGDIWMGWGRTLVNYDPQSGAAKTWSVPAYSGLALLYSMDDRMASLTIDANGEIWVVRSKVTAVFGFNPITERWDHTINLRFAPVIGSRLRVLSPGRLALNGTGLESFDPVFAVIDTANRAVDTYPIDAQRFAVIDADNLIVQGSDGNVSAFNLATGRASMLATGMQVSFDPSADVALDSGGLVWLPLNTGVARLEAHSKLVTRFDFPFIAEERANATRSPGSPLPCPAISQGCRGPAILVPGIESLVVDGRNDVWVVTDWPAVGDPNQHDPMTPIAELTPSPLPGA